jgi:hypothetical protein
MVLAACTAEPSTFSLKPAGDQGLQGIELSDEQLATQLSADPDLCTLAEALPPDDLCSLICDPDALRDAMLEAGVASGRCYLMLCVLTVDVRAQVGICLY